MRTRIVTVGAALFSVPLSVFAFSGVGTVAPSASGVSNVSDFYDIIQIAARWLAVFGVIIGAVFVIIGGIQYMTAGGDEVGTTAAKSKILGGLVGVAIVLLAYAVVNIVGSFFGAGTIVS